MSDSQFNKEPKDTLLTQDTGNFSCVSLDCEFDEYTKDLDLNKVVFGLDEDRCYESLAKFLSFSIKCFKQDGVIMEVTLGHHLCRPSPIGWILNGGTSLALAEVAAALASYARCQKGFHPVGSAISANHISMAKLGEKIKVIATALHVGKTTHVVNVDIKASDGRLISTARVTNTIISTNGL